MTDTNEPKYKVGDIVEVDQGDIHWIGRVTGLGLNSVFLSTGINANDDDENLEFDLSMIRSKVAIYELPDKPQYCKDCEHTKRDERFKDKPWILRFSCVHLEWLKKSGFYMDEFDNDISEYVIDKLQPPPNCHCFTKRQPKESK